MAETILVETQSADILIEAVRSPYGPVPMAGGPLQKIDEQFEELCEKTAQRVRTVAEHVREVLMSELSIEKAEVKLKIGFTAEGKIVIASAKAEAALEFSLTFKGKP